MEKSRTLTNYPHKFFDYPNIFTGKLDRLPCVPTQFNLRGDSGQLIIEVWKSDKAFNNYEDSLQHFRTALPITPDVVKNYEQFFAAIKAGALKFLEVEKDFQVELLTIDLNQLELSLMARHLTRRNRVISDRTASSEEFEQIKTNHPEIVGGLIQFAFEYMATNEDLSKFK